MIYKVGDTKENMICVCADNKTAVFAPFMQLTGGQRRIKYKHMVCYSNYPV